MLYACNIQLEIGKFRKNIKLLLLVLILGNVFIVDAQF